MPKQGRYSSKVTEDLIVEIKRDDEIINEVGPWDTEDGAKEWAAAIVIMLDQEEP